MKFWPLAFFFTLSACSLTPPRPVALHDFGLLPTAADGGKSVVVTAPPWLQDTRLRYRLLFDDPTRIRFYADHRWIAPPPVLIQQQLSALITSPYRLRIALRDFEQIFDTPSRSRVVLRFFAEATTANGQILGAKVFTLEKPTVSADVHGALSGYAELVVQAADEVGEWLKTVRITS